MILIEEAKLKDNKQFEPGLLNLSVGNFAILTFLLREKKLSLLSGDNKGRTALHACALHLQYAEENNWNVSQSTIIQNAKNLIDMDNGLLVQKDHDGNTPIHLAAEKGQLELLRLYLRHSESIHDFNLFEANDAGETILHAASREGRQDVIDFLIFELPRGREMLSCLDKNGFSPFAAAVWNKRTECVKKYVSAYGVNINQRNSRGKALLHIATEKGLLTNLSLLSSQIAPWSPTLTIDLLL